MLIVNLQHRLAIGHVHVGRLYTVHNVMYAALKHLGIATYTVYMSNECTYADVGWLLI